MNRTCREKGNSKCSNVESHAAFPHLNITAAEDGHNLKKGQRIALTEKQQKSDNRK
jgi:hypothetical protein